MMIRKLLSSLTGLSILATSAALIGASVAPYIDPNTFVWTAFLGLMYPFILVLHLILFVTHFLIKRGYQPLLFLIPAFLSANVFLNSFGLNYFNSKEELPANNLKLMTYNVHMFESVDSYKSVQAPMLQLIKNAQPDILCMQDFRSAQEAGLSTIDSIKLVVNASYYYNGPNDPAIGSSQATITISKYPIVNSGRIVLTDVNGGNQAIFTDINHNGTIVRVYNVHFQSLGFQPYEYEEWKNADIPHKFKFLFKVKDKFSAAFASRSNQVKLVKEHAKSCPYPFIIAGDFNDTPPSFAVNYTMSGLKNAFREKGRGYTVTFNGGLPDFQIDYILVKPLFKVLDYKVIRKKYSDHYPVIATLGY